MPKIILCKGLEGEEAVAIGHIPQVDELPAFILFRERVFQYDGEDGDDVPNYIEVVSMPLMDVEEVME